jgi:hypothetical protein
MVIAFFGARLGPFSLPTISKTRPTTRKRKRDADARFASEPHRTGRPLVYRTAGATLNRQGGRVDPIRRSAAVGPPFESANAA